MNQGEECAVGILNFTKDGQPVWNYVQILPIFGDMRSPSLVTHFAGLLHLSPFRADSMAPMQTIQPVHNCVPPPEVTGQPVSSTSRPFFPLAEAGNHGSGILALGPEVRLFPALHPTQEPRVT